MKRLLLIVCLLLLTVPLSAQNNTIDCDADPVLEIWQIQTDTDFSICQGERVITEENIITAIGDFGFFMQTPPERSDDNPATSDGVYVVSQRPIALFGLTVGDSVTVEGRVDEFFNLTQLEVSTPRRVQIISSGNELPEPINLFDVDLEWTVGEDTHPLERYEGMLVTVEDARVVAPTNYFDEFGISLTGERAFREPGVEIDSQPEFANQGVPMFDLNPELIEIDPPEMGLEPLFVAPESRATVTGGLAYSFRDYQIWPRELAVETADEVTRAVRPRDEGEFIIATQNVMNLFDLTNDPRRDDSTTEDYVPDTTDDYQLRLRKLSEQIRVNLAAPDIVAIQEIENARVLTDLAMQINRDDPALIYYGCIQEGNDGRGIDNAYLIRTDNVSVQQCYAMPNSQTVGAPLGGGFLFGRPPLVLEVTLLAGRTTMDVTLVNLHIKSLSGSETETVQRKREAQAMMVADYVQAILDDDPEAKVIVLGDLNGFQFSDGLVDVVQIIQGTHNPDDALVAPERDMLDPNLINQLDRVPDNDRYSFIFNSTLQVLDHILTSPALDAYITDAQFSRGNADALYQNEILDTGVLRAADHDGFVIYINPTLDEE